MSCHLDFLPPDFLMLQCRAMITKVPSDPPPRPRVPPCLVSDSALLGETLELVRQSGGRLHAAAIADFIFKLPNLDPAIAAPLVADLIGADARLRLTENALVELTGADPETRLLPETTFVVVDVETTGAKVPPNRVTEIGAYRVSRGRIVAEFNTLVNPETNIPPFITALTGITDAMVRGAPKFHEIAHDWLDFAGDGVLVAHNAHFDMRFLNHEIARLYPGRRMSNPLLCTVSLARRIYPQLVNHRLHTVAEHFSIPIRDRHRAGGDARATAEIFLHMLAHLQNRGVHDLAGARKYKKIRRD